MWFLWQLLHQANVLLTTNEGSNQYSLLFREITLTPNSVNHPSGFLSNGKDLQIKSSVFCMPISVCHTAELDSPLKTNTGADSRVVYSATYTLVGSCSFLIERQFAVCHEESLIFSSEAMDMYNSFMGFWFLLEINLREA